MRRTHKIFLSFFTVAVAACATAGDYSGNVGKLDAVFSIEWHDDGTVSGTYYYPSRTGVTYSLRGNNHTEGKLYLEEYTNGTLTARCYLSKELSGSAIVWKGEMQNTDGRRLPMAFARARNISPVVTAPRPQPTGTAYRGNVGKLGAVFFLNWKDDGAVTGSYYYPSREGVTYRLQGSNPREGELRLTEYTGNDVTAKCILTKHVTNGEVIWEGQMYNTDGRQFDMAFRRDRSAATEAAAPVSMSPSEEPQVPSLPTTITWNTFPQANQILEMVPLAFEGESFHYGKVSRYRSSETGLRMTFETGEMDWSTGDGPDRFVGNGKIVTLNMARNVPLPSEEIEGKIIYLQFDGSNNLVAISVGGIALTHVRQGSSGKLEIRGLINDDAFDAEANQGAGNAQAKFVEFLPDKVALRLNSPYGHEVYVQTIRLTRDYGVAIQSDSAGPGMLELESLDLEPPAETNPWYPVSDKNVPFQVPANQQTGEAG